MSDTRFSLPLGNGTLEICGSEDFVEKQLTKFEEQIRAAVQIALNLRSQPKQLIDSKQDEKGKAQLDSTLSEDSSNVLEIHDGKIHILKDIPGQNNKEKTVNAALLYLHGSNMAGTEEISFEPIRGICKDHGFLDSTNFAKYLKSEKALFVFSGSSRSQMIKLSVPGQKKAAELVRELNQAQ